MVQRLPEGRKKTKRVESQAVEDVCLIARNALDRISELKRRPMSAYKEYEVRERLRKTKERLNAHQELAAALMEPKPWVGLTDEEIENLMNKFDVAFTDYAGVYKAIESKLKEKNGG